MSELNSSRTSGDALPEAIRVFVNERGVSVPRGSHALDAVRAHNAAWADDVAGERSRITDSRGLPLAPDTALLGGAILRVLGARASANELGVEDAS